MFRKNEEKKARRRPKRPFRERTIAYVLEGIVCIGIMAGFCYGAYLYVETSQSFKVRTIRVEGAVKLPPQNIVTASGVTSDDCLLLLSSDEVKRRVCSVPYIKSCKINRIFPDKLIIKIQERVALATLMVNNRQYEVDDEGNVLRELPVDNPPVPPFITNVPGLDLVEVGQKVTQPSLIVALAVWAAFSRTAMSRDVTVSEISAARENRICMYCDELPFEIRWGRDKFEKQAKKLDIFWQSQNKKIQCKEYLELWFGDDVTCK
jgi:cell division protein FtsQ